MQIAQHENSICRPNQLNVAVERTQRCDFWIETANVFVQGISARMPALLFEQLGNIVTHENSGNPFSGMPLLRSGARARKRISRSEKRCPL
jgi:hypothetical protein